MGDSQSAIYAGHPQCGIIHHERHWLACEHLHPLTGGTGVGASRWSGSPISAYETNGAINQNYHVIALPLRSMRVSLFAASRLVHDGRMLPGAAKINLPSQELRAIFSSAYDVLHLHIPNQIVADCVETSLGRLPSAGAAIPDAPMPSDPVLDRLARAFMRADDLGDALGLLYAESMALAIVARVLSLSLGATAPGRTAGTSGLPKWRLKRTVDFIEAHLGEPIGLAEMAAASGLSRMHFAAQFRTATGVRPHEYLLRRRTEKAQDLLSGSGLPLVEVALEVGFKSQSHFTTVFTRLVGETPNRWRQRSRLLAAVTAPVTAPQIHIPLSVQAAAAAATARTTRIGTDL